MAELLWLLALAVWLAMILSAAAVTREYPDRDE